MGKERLLSSEAKITGKEAKDIPKYSTQMELKAKATCFASIW
jgi:hypothetical protein